MLKYILIFFLYIELNASQRDGLILGFSYGQNSLKVTDGGSKYSSLNGISYPMRFGWAFNSKWSFSFNINKVKQLGSDKTGETESTSTSIEPTLRYYPIRIMFFEYAFGSHEMTYFKKQKGKAFYKRESYGNAYSFGVGGETFLIKYIDIAISFGTVFTYFNSSESKETNYFNSSEKNIEGAKGMSQLMYVGVTWYL